MYSLLYIGCISVYENSKENLRLLMNCMRELIDN